MPSAATTESPLCTPTATQQAPKAISSTVVASVAFRDNGDLVAQIHVGEDAFWSLVVGGMADFAAASLSTRCRILPVGDLGT
jgi:hypothetical protein